MKTGFHCAFEAGQTDRAEGAVATIWLVQVCGNDCGLFAMGPGLFPDLEIFGCALLVLPGVPHFKSLAHLYFKSAAHLTLKCGTRNFKVPLTPGDEIS